MNTLLIIVIFLSQFIFLLPIRDRRPYRRGFPWMTTVLVGVNVLIHIWVTLSIYALIDAKGESAWRLLYPFMEVPDLILNRQGLGTLSILTSGFLHADLGHLLGNMFILWFFGRKVEDATGPLRFILFYLLCLFTAGLLSVVVRGALPGRSSIPGLGASGAIFGVMTGYFFLYANERVLTLVSTWFAPLIPIPLPVPGGCFIPVPIPIWLPAWVYILHGLLINAMLGQLVQAGELFLRVNVFAHLGGAVGGVLFIYFFLHPDVFAQRRR